MAKISIVFNCWLEYNSPMKIAILFTLLLTGCGTFVKTENIYVDNSAVNNFVGNPCGFYLGDRCLVLKDGDSARNPNNPYKNQK